MIFRLGPCALGKLLAIKWAAAYITVLTCIVKGGFTTCLLSFFFLQISALLPYCFVPKLKYQRCSYLTLSLIAHFLCEGRHKRVFPGFTCALESQVPVPSFALAFHTSNSLSKFDGTKPATT